MQLQLPPPLEHITLTAETFKALCGETYAHMGDDIATFFDGLTQQRVNFLELAAMEMDRDTDARIFFADSIRTFMAAYMQYRTHSDVAGAKHLHGRDTGIAANFIEGLVGQHTAQQIVRTTMRHCDTILDREFGAQPQR
jgi:hypothetical protein